MGLEIVVDREGRWFHENSRGLFYYPDHDSYLQDKKSYLPRGPCCGEYVFPDQRAATKTFSRIGLSYVHQDCLDAVSSYRIEDDVIEFRRAA